MCLKPPRATYDPSDTPAVIERHNKTFCVREDVEFLNPFGEKLCGSLWRESGFDLPTSCMIYLHSLGTNQFECINLIPFICNRDLAVFSFDFPGSGASGGDTIPLINNGTETVLSAAEMIRKRYRITQLGLWGRSMGAAVALDVVSSSNDFRFVVSDSAFSSASNIVYDQARMKNFPRLLVKLAEPYLKRQVRKLAGSAIDLQYPLAVVNSAKTPLLLGHGKRDNFVPLAQAEELFERYGFSDKQLYVFNAKHNTKRPDQWYEAAARFVYRKMEIDSKVRSYDSVYSGAKLHIGNIETVLREIQGIV